MPDNKKRLEELELDWSARFAQQPKLPSSAMLTAVFSMAFAFGAIMFFMFASVRRYTWIWIVLSLSLGIVNRILAQRWYVKIVEWHRERTVIAKEIEQLRSQR